MTVLSLSFLALFSKMNLSRNLEQKDKFDIYFLHCAFQGWQMLLLSLTLISVPRTGMQTEGNLSSTSQKLTWASATRRSCHGSRPIEHLPQ